MNLLFSNELEFLVNARDKKKKNIQIEKRGKAVCIWRFGYPEKT